MSLPRAFTALSGATAVSMTAQLARGKLAALFLGPAGVGIFNQLSVTWNLFQLGGQLGSFNGTVQHGADALSAGNRDALRRLVATSTLLLGAVSVVMALVGVLLAPLLSNLLLHDGGAHAGLVSLLALGVPIGVSAQTYRALLSAARAVPQLVRTQILSDVGAAIVFAALVVPLGLSGAILGFLSTHLLLFVIGFFGARRVLGPGMLTPRIRDFRWSVVRSNVGFSLSGLVMVALSNLSLLIVSRILIAHFGLAANGIFSNAWRIASVYLGAITTTTISYVLPTLTGARDSDQLSRDLSTTLRFYLIILPPVMVGIMAGGDLLVWLILSSQFQPVAPLLLLFVPAELFRVLGETLTVPLLARRRMLPFTLAYLAQAGIFVAVAAVLIPHAGAAGAAAAYAISTVLGFVIDCGAAIVLTKARIDRETIAIGLSATALLVGAAIGFWWFGSLPARLAIGLSLVALWFAANSRSREFMRLVSGGIGLLPGIRR